MPNGYQMLYDFPQIKQMIMFDNEEDFNEQLGVLRTRMTENDTFLREIRNCADIVLYTFFCHFDAPSIKETVCYILKTVSYHF